jgi:uncharacterized protein
MILEFSIGNFRSIKEVQHISFVASNIVSKNKEIDENNTFQVTDKHRLMKSKVIYGANASGKSNFIRGFMTFWGTIQFSVQHSDALNAIEPFLLSTETEKNPTFFQLFFILEEVVYRYGFEATKNEIKSEWLFGTPNTREVNYFIRNEQHLEVNPKYFKEGHRFHGLLNDSNPIFRKNSLFLSSMAAFNGDLSQKIVTYILGITILPSLGNRFIRSHADKFIFSSEIRKDKVLNLLQKADISISGLVFRIIEKKEQQTADSVIDDEAEKSIFTLHKKYDNNFNEIEQPVIFHFDSSESEGSRRMYEMAPLLITALETGNPLIIDEFEARLHPKISKQIIELFNSPKTNPKNAQLLVVTHDTNLLSSQLFRRDQICFVEKDKYEASHIYTLAEFKGVRNDASFEKDYLDGRYGAVPFLNGFSTIFEN